MVATAGSSPVTQARENPRSFEAFSGLRGVFAFREIECSGHYFQKLLYPLSRKNIKADTERTITTTVIKKRL